MQKVPGLTYPTVKGLLAGNPKDSSIQSLNQMNQKQNSLNNSVGGTHNKRKSRRNKTRKNKTNKRRKSIQRKRHKGRSRKGSGIPVPQFQMQYTPTGGPGQDPNALIVKNSQITGQGVTNAQYDKNATIKGGKRT
jgi:hypothetical protein